MRRIGERQLQFFGFAGARMLRDLLRQEGVIASKKPIGGLMEKMGVGALYRQANSGKRAAGSFLYPYLPHNLSIAGPNNQV